ncbi:head completion/stabilization protein [Rhodospira trueperi]|uniref:Phage head completion protein (GPL) n=1 Tax=Rhodospira trueperi TaxID=69960 RepID=A0A1G7HWM3_9PROT|nr:head completion/stabilization protein [Rhodospira trueperi]SDF04656.1 Phage head completion protein (GPL) [Rhodospira trueperi]
MVSVIPHTAAPADPVLVAVDPDGWYPPVDVTALRARTGLDGTWSDGRLTLLVREAADAVADVLADWRADREAEGAATLAAVAPTGPLDGTPLSVWRWRTAIECRVRAAVIRATRDFHSTGDGHDRADALEPTADEWLARAHEALSRLMGRPRATIELI